MRVIVVGGGEVGFTIARHVAEEKIDVVMIEQDEDRCRAAREELDIAVVCGNGASPRLLSEAGIDDANILIAVTNSDEVNLVACAVAAKINSAVRRIARVRDSDFMRHIERFDSAHLGVDLVINLDMEAGRTIMNLLDLPTADGIQDFADGKVRLIGFQVQENAPVIGRSLMELAGDFDLRKVLIVAIEREGHVVIPRGDDVIRDTDFLWMVAGAEHNEMISTMVGKSFHPIKRVMICGGTDLAYELARMLENRGIWCRLIVEGRQRAEDLAEKLEDAVVIHGRGIDLGLLREENIGEVSAFIAATAQDDENILSAVLANQEGVPRVIAVIEGLDYAKVVSSIGVHTRVSKNAAAVSAILSMVRKGKILSTSLLGQDAEVIEYKALETTEIVKAPLKDTAFPKGALLGAIVRDGEVIIPSGDDQVRVGDRILIFTLKKAVKKVEKLTTVTPSFF